LLDWIWFNFISPAYEFRIGFLAFALAKKEKEAETEKNWVNAFNLSLVCRFHSIFIMLGMGQKQRVCRRFKDTESSDANGYHKL